MRETKWTTTRWRLPGKIRVERFRQLYGKHEHKELFNESFLIALEHRRDLLESRSFKLFAIQAAIFLMLAFALLDLDVKVTVLGFSTDSAKSVREVLVVVQVILAIVASRFDHQLSDVKEMLKGGVAKLAGDNIDVKEFLQARYGLTEFTGISAFDKQLRHGGIQIALASSAAIALTFFFGAVLVFGLAIQVLTLLEIYTHPNFSFLASVVVIVFVLCGDVLIGTINLLSRSFQPFQTLEDFEKLTKLANKDEAKYAAIIREIVEVHLRKGSVRRLLTRPKMKRIP